jgi:hypothetical protein
MSLLQRGECRISHGKLQAHLQITLIMTVQRLNTLMASHAVYAGSRAA